MDFRPAISDDIEDKPKSKELATTLGAMPDKMQKACLSEASMLVLPASVP